MSDKVFLFRKDGEWKILSINWNLESAKASALKQCEIQPDQWTGPVKIDDENWYQYDDGEFYYIIETTVEG